MARNRLRLFVALITFSGLIAAGCAQTPPPAAPAPPRPAPPPAAVAPSPPPGPTDPQIAAIAYTAGEADIANAKLALRKSHNKQVRAFANEMVRDHTAVNKQALALVKKLHVTPEPNPTSESVAQQEKDKRAELAKLKGAEFDKAYAENEVAYHQLVNGALQQTLIPSAQNPELKSLLETGLKIFQGHQQHAEELASKLP
jgi:putative membrane protein